MATNLDPTRDEMREYLNSTPFIHECDEFDIEESIYWFASDYHGGQWSNLYAALCASDYSPGPITTGCEPDSVASYLYDELVQHFAPSLRFGETA